MPLGVCPAVRTENISQPVPREQDSHGEKDDRLGAPDPEVANPSLGSHLWPGPFLIRSLCYLSACFQISQELNLLCRQFLFEPPSPSTLHGVSQVFS